MNLLIQRNVLKFRLHKDTSAGAAIEAAVAFPLLIFLLLASIELTRYIWIIQKVDHAAYTIADLVTTTLPPTNPPELGTLQTSTVSDHINLFENLMFPYPTSGRGTVIVTSFQQIEDDQTIIRWQLASNTVLPVASDISGTMPVGGVPSLRNQPVSFSTDIQTSLAMSGGLQTYENLIAVEVFYQYQPLIGGVFGVVNAGTLIERQAFFAPRFGNLADLPPDFPVL